MNSKSFKNGVVFNADCIKIMDALINKGMKIDMILCDLPFGTTASNWDKAIPAKSLWERYKKLISDNGSIVLFASGQFMPYLLSSNLNMFNINAGGDYASQLKLFGGTDTEAIDMAMKYLNQVKK